MTPENFKRIRQQLGLTQAELARALRITEGRTIRRYESGERPISGPVAIIMEALADGRIDLESL